MLQNHEQNGVTMTATSKDRESADHQDDLEDLQTGSLPHVIEFFTAREQMIADRYGNTEPFGYKNEKRCIPSRRELLHPLFDPMEDWVNSLISGAALVSLLIGILCWPSFTATKAERTRLLPISQTETFRIVQKPD
jgi:hypothetical protein